jgi:hydrogenase maturation protease
MLVVGVGQPLAGDDGVGPEVARALAEGGVPALRATDGAALVTLLEGERRAIIVDAAVGAGPAGTVRVFGPGELPSLPHHPSSSHGLSVAEAIALARALGPIDIDVVAVSIDPPRAGAAGLSPRVAAAVPIAVAAVRALLEARSP